VALRVRCQLIGGDLTIEIRVDGDLGRLAQDRQRRLGDRFATKTFGIIAGFPPLAPGRRAILCRAPESCRIGPPRHSYPDALPRPAGGHSDAVVAIDPCGDEAIG
jgi:hypothetical protein